MTCVADRVRGALWGACIGDALAMPSHWYYGGARQVAQDYGGEIKGYVKPQKHLQGSIMNLSNTGGGGRGSDKGSIIGDTINHGKKQYWTGGRGHHYHCTLDAGENTLECSLLMQLVDSVTECGGRFDSAHFRDKYVDFMTTPGSHNDCYASTCHRMFFANRAKGLPLDKCPDNDKHNVDTIDGLVLPLGVALATRSLADDAACQSAAEASQTTRSSAPLAQYSGALTLLFRALLGGAELRPAVLAAAAPLGMSVPHLTPRQDAVVA
jgi:ADP-ribosyl-[dinitrogen reductase] hydrolase